MPHSTPSAARTLSAFIHVSLDGYYCDARADMSFAYRRANDPEWQAFVAENASGGGALLLGRITYDLMAAWWPSPAAAQSMPQVAARMNAMPKYVASRQMETADWLNTSVLRGDLASAVRDLKAREGPDITVLGSGTIITQLAEARLLDELQVIVNPIALGSGKSLFAPLEQPLEFELTRSRSFRNGSVSLWYAFAEPGSA